MPPIIVDVIAHPVPIPDHLSSCCSLAAMGAPV